MPAQVIHPSDKRMMTCFIFLLEILSIGTPFAKGGGTGDVFSEDMTAAQRLT